MSIKVYQNEINVWFRRRNHQNIIFVNRLIFHKILRIVFNDLRLLTIMLWLRAKGRSFIWINWQVSVFARNYCMIIFASLYRGFFMIKICLEKIFNFSLTDLLVNLQKGKIILVQILLGKNFLTSKPIFQNLKFSNFPPWEK